MIEKITSLSSLPQFNGGATEHGLFTFVVVCLALLMTIFAVVAVKSIIFGIQTIWTKGCEVRQSAINAKIKIEEEHTKQIQIKPKMSW